MRKTFFQARTPTLLQDGDDDDGDHYCEKSFVRKRRLCRRGGACADGRIVDEEYKKDILKSSRGSECDRKNLRSHIQTWRCSEAGILIRKISKNKRV